MICKRVTLALVSWLLFAMFVGMFALFIIGLIQNRQAFIIPGFFASVPMILLFASWAIEVRLSVEARSWEYCSCCIFCTAAKEAEELIPLPNDLALTAIPR